MAQLSRRSTFEAGAVSFRRPARACGTATSTTTPTRAWPFWSLDRWGERDDVAAVQLFRPGAQLCVWSENVNKLCRMDPTVDGNPIGWSVKQMKHKLPDMLRAAGYEDIANKVDAQAVSQTLA